MIKYSTLFFSFLLFIGVAYSSQAQQYTLTDNDVVVIDGVIKSCSYGFGSTDIIIPDTLDGQAVTEILDTDMNNGVFMKKGITSVILPQNLKSIGRSAFCSNVLTSVVIPEGVTSISEYAFRSNRLTSVSLPNSLCRIEQAAFLSNSSLNSITLPTISISGQIFMNWIDSDGNTYDNGTEVSDFTRFYMAKFAYTLTDDDVVVTDGVILSCSYDFANKNIIIPEMLDSQEVIGIGSSAFKSKALTSILIPEGVTNIGLYAFYGNALTSIDLPSTLTSIGWNAFGFNSSLRSITLPSVSISGQTSLNWKDSDGNTYENGTEVSCYYTSYNAKFAYTYTLTDDDVVVTDGVIMSCSYNFTFTNIIIPETLDSQEVIGIGKSAFYNKGITSIDLPATLSRIGSAGFKFNSLSSVVIPEGVNSIDTYAFYNNDLTSIDLPSTLTSIGSSAFSTNALISVVIPEGVNSIGTYAFYNNDLISIDLPATLTSIGSGAFYNNDLTSVVIPEGVNSIGTYAFYNNDLTSIDLPSTLTSIGSSAFSTNALTSVIIPEGVTSIGNNAFGANSSLSSFTLPTASSLGQTSFNWKGSNGNTYENGTEVSTYYTSYNAKFLYTLTDDDVVVTDGVITSCSYDFSLTDIIIPETLDSQEVIGIGNSDVFYNKGITSVTFPYSLTSIGSYAFYSNALTSVTIPDGVTSIGTSAFGNNTSLVSFILPISDKEGYTAHWVGSDGVKYAPGAELTDKSLSYNLSFEINTYELSNNIIFENLSSGTEIGTFSLIDEGSETTTFTIVENEFFELSGDKLISKSVFDFEIQDSYSVEISGTDQSDLSYFERFSINITDVYETPNSTPYISISESIVNYTEDDNATQLDASGTVYDTEGDWNGGSLTVQLTGNSEYRDEISIPDNLVGSINTNGTNLQNGSTLIGTLSSSEARVINGKMLTITFNSNATNALVQQTLQAISYRSTSDDPSTSDKTVTFVVTDKYEGSTSVTKIVNITNVEDAPTVVTNNRLYIYEGATKTISLDTLESDDGDTDNSTLTYTVTSLPANGQLENTDNLGVAITSFTQQNLIDNKIKYIHDGSNTTSDAFTFTVSDGTNELTDQIFNITVRAVDDDIPTITTNNGLKLYEGATKTIPLDSLESDDGDTDNSTLTYTVTSLPANGQLENTDNSGVVITSFTQQNLIDDKIQYVHDGSNTTSDAFIFTVADGIPNKLTRQIFTITILAVDDDTPRITTNNGLKLYEGVTKTIPLDSLEAYDRDTDNSTLTYTVTSLPANGQLENTDNLGVAISSFTQQNLIDGRIQYSHDGSNTTSDAFTFTVSDGTNELTDQIFNITVRAVDDDIPIITKNNGLKLYEGATKTIPLDSLESDDTDTDNVTLLYTITTALSNGKLENTDNSGVSISSFTQQDLADGKIKYVHDGSNTTSDAFIFTVADGIPNELTMQTFIITVVAVNDNIPLLTSNQRFSVMENVANFTRVGNVIANDPDTGTILQDWIFTSGNEDGIFEINGSTGEITIADNTKLDFESITDYTLSVSVSDGTNTSLVETINIDVKDINEAPTAIHLSNATIAENLDIGTEVGTFTASDVDASQTFTYTIVENENFEIVGDQLVSKLAFDFETKDSYSAELTVTDQGGLSFNQNFILEVIDANEAPTEIQLSNSTIAENQAIGTEVAILTATDEDADQTFTYTIKANENFEIIGDKLITKSSLDFETKDSYSVEITVTDQDGLSFKQSFTVQITDVNDAPTAIQLSNATIAENSEVGTEVGILTAIEEDADQTFTYTITENENFELVGDKLITKSSFDFETLDSYSVEITVADQNDLSYTESFSITITDVNDGPSDIQLSSNTIAENSAIGIEVGILTASDVDASQTFTYTIVENENFELVGDKLVSKSTFDFETLDSYSVEITVADQNDLSYTESFSITITDVNEAPVFVSEAIIVGAEDVEYVYTVECADVDGDALSVLAIEKPDWLSLVDNGDGKFMLSGTPTLGGSYHVVLEAQDSEFTVEQEFDIEVEVVTGIEPDFSETEVSIYPNPVANELHINLSNLKGQEVSIALFSLTGNLISKKDYQTVDGEVRISKSVQNLPSGIYLLVLNTDSTRKTYKIVKE